MKLLKLIPGPTSIAWVLITAALLVSIDLYKPVAVESIQLKGFDVLLASDTLVKSDSVVVVDIGKASIERLGQQHWDRRELGRAVARIQELGAASIIVPVIMNEADKAGSDKEFATALRTSNAVLAQVPTTQNKKPDIVRRGVAVIGGEAAPWLYHSPGALAPYKLLADTAAGVGTSVVVPDVDGVVRRMPMVVAVGQEIYPSLPLEALRVATAQQSYQIKVSAAGVEKVRIAGQPVIATDEHARVWLRWHKEFSHYELSELKNKKIDLKGKIVVLTVEGSDGIIATTRGQQWAHTVQAQTVQTLLDSNSPVRPAYANVIELIIIILIAVALYFVINQLSIWAVGIALVVTVAGVISGSFYAWNHYSQLWDIYYLTIASVLLYGHTLIARFVIEFKQKHQRRVNSK